MLWSSPDLETLVINFAFATDILVSTSKLSLNYGYCCCFGVSFATQLLRHVCVVSLKIKVHTESCFSAESPLLERLVCIFKGAFLLRKLNASKDGKASPLKIGLLSLS